MLNIISVQVSKYHLIYRGLKTGNFLSKTDNLIVYRGGLVLFKQTNLTHSVDDVSAIVLLSYYLITSQSPGLSKQSSA